jgi:hypothetical protein
MGWTGASRALRSLKSALRVDIGSDIYEAVPAAMAGIGWGSFTMFASAVLATFL